VGAEVLHSSVLDALGQEITGGVLQPGSVVTLDRIQKRFGVSRTVARETMRLLESMQLVTSKRRVGLVVRPVVEWDVFDPRVIRWRLQGSEREAQLRSLTELRAAVEPVAAGAAARYATEHDRARIVELAAQMRAHGEDGAREVFLDLDVEFHGLLLRASRNEMFASLTGVVTEVLAGRTRHGLMPDIVRPEALVAHETVARAVHDGDAAEAERAMTAIMAEVREALSVLDDLPG
jgi:DNA-binding FadR family transcriptional regulator